MVGVQIRVIIDVLTRKLLYLTNCLLLSRFHYTEVVLGTEIQVYFDNNSTFIELNTTRIGLRWSSIQFLVDIFSLIQ